MAKRSKKKKAVAPDQAAPRPHHEPSVRISTGTTNRFIPALGLVLFLAGISFAAYWPSLKGDFVYDARMEIVGEGFATSLSHLPDVLSLKVLGMDLMLGTRPGQLLYEMLVATVSGKDPFGYHLGSNLLHAGNVALLFVLLLRLLATEESEARAMPRAWLAALAVTLIFAFHPLGVESVAEISYSSSLLVTFFTLTALLAATFFRPGNFRAMLAAGSVGVVCSFASVASKESGVATALLLAVYWFLYRRREAREPWFWFLGGALAAMAAFLAARFLMAPAAALSPSTSQHIGYLGGSFGRFLLIQPGLWVFMMGKLAWPVGLSADYAPVETLGPSAAPALAILFAVVALQAWLAWRNRIGALGVAIYWLGLAAVSNFIPLYRPLADRFYYLPLAGVSLQLLAVLLLAQRWRWGFQAALLPFLAALPFLIFLTVARQNVFLDDFSLWSDTVRATPLSWTGHNNLGSVFLKQGRFDEAIAQYQKGLTIRPDDPQTESNFGVALVKKGQTEEGLVHFRKALAIFPRYAEAHYDFGMALLQKGLTEEALAEFRKALELRPNHADTHHSLGLALFQKGRVDEALAEYRRALELDHENSNAHYSLALALAQKGETDEAISHYRQAVAESPDFAEAHYNLGNLLVQKGDADAAQAQFQATLDYDPRHANAETNLGNILVQKGAIDEALRHFQKALEIEPDNANAHNGLGVVFLQKGEPEKAIVQFQEVVRLRPHDSDALNNLTKMKAALGQRPSR